MRTPQTVIAGSVGMSGTSSGVSAGGKVGISVASLPVGSRQVIFSLASSVLQGLPHLALQRMHLICMRGLRLREPRLPLPLQLTQLQRACLPRLLCPTQEIPSTPELREAHPWMTEIPFIAMLRIQHTLPYYDHFGSVL